MGKSKKSNRPPLPTPESSNYEVETKKFMKTGSSKKGMRTASCIDEKPEVMVMYASTNFLYGVETDSDDDEINETVEYLLQDLILRSLQERYCNNRRRRLNIISMHTFSRDSEIGYCTIKHHLSKSCIVYAVTVNVMYDSTKELSNGRAVIDSVFETERVNVEANFYLRALNNALRKTSNDLSVTKIQFGGLADDPELEILAHSEQMQSMGNENQKKEKSVISTPTHFENEIDRTQHDGYVPVHEELEHEQELVSEENNVGKEVMIQKEEKSESRKDIATQKNTQSLKITEVEPDSNKIGSAEFLTNRTGPAIENLPVQYIEVWTDGSLKNSGDPISGSSVAGTVMLSLVGAFLSIGLFLFCIIFLRSRSSRYRAISPDHCSKKPAKDRKHVASVTNDTSYCGDDEILAHSLALSELFGDISYPLSPRSPESSCSRGTYDFVAFMSKSMSSLSPSSLSPRGLLFEGKQVNPPSPESTNGYNMEVLETGLP